eukprot:829614_1
MSHSFPNLQAHPTLTPNPTFLPQPHPLPLTLTTMTQQQKQSTNPNSNSNNPNNISPLPPSQHPSLLTPMQFIPPPPHTYTHSIIRPHTTSHSIAHPNATPDYSQLTNTIVSRHPPPLTHENDIVSQDLNDINTSTSNDESNSNTTNSNPHNKGEKPSNNIMGDNDGDQDIDLNTNNNRNNNNATPPNHPHQPPPGPGPGPHTSINHGPFGSIYMNHELQPPPHTHTHIIHPGNGPFGSNIDDRKHTNNKLSYYGVMPSPFMPQHTSNHNNGLSYSAAMPQHEHDNDTHKNDNSNPINHNGVGQWLMIPPQQIQNVNVAPMFGHPAYLPNDAYLRRHHYGEQTMVDVPHVTPVQISDDIDPKNPSISMLIGTTTNTIQPELNIEHSINTNNHIINSTSSSPSKSPNRSHKKDSHRKKRKRKHRDHKRDSKREKRKHRNNNNNNNNTKEDTKSKYVSIRDEQSVKGGAGNGYRMVLDEPVNKNMLSCHQCKNKKTLDRIIVCGHVYRINNTVKTCTKKYCKSCLLRFYLEAPPTDNQDPSWSSWKCPCCRYICCCAWCRKKKAKRLESVSNAIRAEAHRLTPAISLARKLVSESRVNNNQNQNETHSKHSKKRVHRNHHNDIP